MSASILFKCDSPIGLHLPCFYFHTSAVCKPSFDRWAGRPFQIQPSRPRRRVSAFSHLYKMLPSSTCLFLVRRTRQDILVFMSTLAGLKHPFARRRSSPVIVLNMHFLLSFSLLVAAVLAQLPPPRSVSFAPIKYSGNACPNASGRDSVSATLSEDGTVRGILAHSYI